MNRRIAIALSLWPGSTRPGCVEVWRELDRVGQLDRWHPGPEPPLARVASRLDPRLRGPALGVTRAAVEATVRGADRDRIGVVAWSDSTFPTELRHIVDPPPVLWVRGTLDARPSVSVAIVGSRSASPHALAVSERLAGDLASRGVTVVSGLARGADAAAHRGALLAGGRTIAVLGSGVDVVYPPEHAGLASSVQGSGALVSEFVPGTRPRRSNFPRRNRLIAGLSLAVVVVEASERSGSLITARQALEQGREVMAVPGLVLSGRNRGGHALIKDGAKLVEDADDILDELSVAVPRAPERARRVDRPEDALVRALEEGRAYDLDELIEASGMTSGQLLPRLLSLELEGEISRVAGGRFVRSCRKVVT